MKESHAQITPEVSVVILVRNRFHELRQALRSIQAQNYSTEVILVDDSDQPGMESVLEEFPLNYNWIKNSTRLGITRSRNLGKNLAKGQFIAFLDSDDFWEAGFLKRSIDYLKKNPEASGCVSLTNLVLDKSLSRSLKMKITAFTRLKDILLLLSFIADKKRLNLGAPYLCQLSHVVLRNKNLPSFDESMHIAEDWKFLFQIMKQKPIYVLPRRLVFHRYSSTSNTSTMVREKANFKSEGYKKLIEYFEQNTSSNIYLKLFKIYAERFTIGGA